MYAIIHGYYLVEMWALLCVVVHELSNTRFHTYYTFKRLIIMYFGMQWRFDRTFFSFPVYFGQTLSFVIYAKSYNLKV